MVGSGVEIFLERSHETVNRCIRAGTLPAQGMSRVLLHSYSRETPVPQGGTEEVSCTAYIAASCPPIPLSPHVGEGARGVRGRRL